MRLGESQLPRQTSVLDAGPPRCTSTAIVTADENVVCLGFGDTGSDDANTNFGDELDGDARARVGALEIVDELRAGSAVVL